jgi:hypothetical protein
MATDPKKRQKKLERRSAKRKAKQHEFVRTKSAGLPERLTAAAHLPILHSCATLDLWKEGLGWVCLSRQLPNDSVAFGVFLVDRYCLGVKNAMAGITSRHEYDTQVMHKMRSEFTSKDLTPATARKFVEAAVEYARGLGFAPHPDYQRARLIFGAIDPAESTENLELGKDGKPLFISGPYDTPERCRHILHTLEQHCGPEGFHYVLPFPDATDILPASLRKQDTFLIGKDETGEIIDRRINFDEEDTN